MRAIPNLFLTIAEQLSGRARLGRAFRHCSANSPVSRPVNARRLFLRVSSRTQGRPHVFDAHLRYWLSSSSLLSDRPASPGAGSPPERSAAPCSIPPGGRIAQASIVVVNTATGMRYTATSDAEGRFAFELLPPGDYSARVTAQGMSPQVTPQLHVDVGPRPQLEFHLAIAGSAGKCDRVRRARPGRNLRPAPSPRCSTSAPSNDVPLNGRRFSDLALFSPGVTQDPRSLTSSTNGDLSFGGIRGFQNSTLVDGGDYNNAFFAQARGRYRAPYQFSTEVVQEFRVSTNSYGAEQGRAGGAVINVVTKSGSNHVHGTAFYYLRDSSFGAPIRSWHLSRTTASSSSEAPSAARSSATRFSSSPDSISTFSTSPNVVEFLDGSFAGRARSAGTGPYTPGDYEATDQALVFAAAAQLTSLAGAISRRANRQHFLCQARYQSLAAPATRAAREHDALLGSEQRVPRSRQPGHIRLHQRQRRRKRSLPKPRRCR